MVLEAAVAVAGSRRRLVEQEPLGALKGAFGLLFLSTRNKS